MAKAEMIFTPWHTYRSENLKVKLSLIFSEKLK